MSGWRKGLAPTTGHDAASGPESHSPSLTPTRTHNDLRQLCMSTKTTHCSLGFPAMRSSSGYNTVPPYWRS